MATFFFRLSSRTVFAFVFDLFAHFLHCIAAAQFRSFIISSSLVVEEEEEILFFSSRKCAVVVK
jgi:hypothetical protein